MSAPKPQAKSARYLILQAIHTHGPLTYDDLTEKIPSLNAAQVKNNVAAAKQPGLVKIGRDDVTGRLLVSLTQSGKDWWKANCKTSSEAESPENVGEPTTAADFSNAPDPQYLEPEDYALPAADPALLASANRMLSERLEKVADVLRGSGLELFADADSDDGLAENVRALLELFKRSQSQATEYCAAHAASRALVAEMAERLNVDSCAPHQDILKTLDVFMGSIPGIVQEAAASGYLVAATKRRPTIRRNRAAAEKLAASFKRAGAAKAHIYTLYPAGQAVTEVVIK